ncbi:MAG: sugar ABC transporter ATP-binding protein [Nocardioidaceae bacterium]|nr:sugar ABC transporter ATP-binding protein [Nocardioidaceae bacterium]
MAAAVEMRGITMSFGANEVLKGIDLDLAPGEVTAMLGANGAGKSTLIKVLSGVNAGYGGQITIDGETVTIDHPTTAHSHGIQAVHQRIADGVVPGLTVAENLLFEGIVNNQVPRAKGLRGLMPRARQMTSVLDLGWSDELLRKDVYELPIAEQQLLLLCRALVITPRLLILDEPTSALSETEAERLFDVIRGLRDKGVAIFYVSHRLAEIDQIADRLLVLRDGVIRSEQNRPFEWASALHEMLDADETSVHDRSVELRGTQEVMQLHDVQLLPKSTPFDLSIRAREVTGVFGLLGSGGNELAHGMFGSEHFVSGTMTLQGRPFKPKSPADAIARDVYMVPEDRATGTLIKDWTVSMISTFPFLGDVSRLSVLDRRAEATVGRSVIDDFGVVAQSEEEPVLSLSGGNQQKVVVGRWLRKQPTVMILTEPFQGVDVGARHDLAEKAREVATAGSAVIVVSTDLEEIMEVADRVVILADGHLRFDAYLSDTTRDEILQRLSEVTK